MSNTISHAEDAVHSGPIKNPRQFITMVLVAFVLPIFLIIGLVLYVTTDYLPAGSTSPEKMGMGGVSPIAQERAVALRLQKVGRVEIKGGDQPLRSGEAVYTAQCSACHAAGVAGAPKFQDKAAWASRITHGYEALLTSALKGKGAMGPQGGGDFQDLEIGRAVVYMANAGGANFAEPKAGEGAAGTATAAAPTTTAPAEQAATPATAASAVLAAAPENKTETAKAAGSSAATAVAAAGETAASIAGGAAGSTAPAATALAAGTPKAATEPAAPTSAAAPAAATAIAAVSPVPAAAGPGVDLAAGEALYKSACFACHAAGVAGAPKLGDKAAWAPRIATGMDTLVKAAIHGKGVMPARGGSTASDEAITSAVAYMVNAAK